MSTKAVHVGKDVDVVCWLCSDEDFRISPEIVTVQKNVAGLFSLESENLQLVIWPCGRLNEWYSSSACRGQKSGSNRGVITRQLHVEDAVVTSWVKGTILIHPESLVWYL